MDIGELCFVLKKEKKEKKKGKKKKEKRKSFEERGKGMTEVVIFILISVL